MTPTLASNLLKPSNSTEINALASSGETVDGVSDELFASEFSVAIQDLLPTDGKLKPLQLASLEGLDSQQLTDFIAQNGDELPPGLLSEAIELKQQLPLNTLALAAHASVEDANVINLVAKPEANTLLKTNKLSDESSEDGLLNRELSKPDVLRGRLTVDELQQATLKKGTRFGSSLERF